MCDPPGTPIPTWPGETRMLSRTVMYAPPASPSIMPEPEPLDQFVPWNWLLAMSSGAAAEPPDW